MERIEPVGPDRSVPSVEFKRLTPLEREQERQRREQERKRRRPKPQPPREGGGDRRPGLRISSQVLARADHSACSKERQGVAPAPKNTIIKER